MVGMRNPHRIVVANPEKKSATLDGGGGGAILNRRLKKQTRTGATGESFLIHAGSVTGGNVLTS
jgi:hypothetical protein